MSPECLVNINFFGYPAKELFVMIFFVADNGTGPVHLFSQNQSY